MDDITEAFDSAEGSEDVGDVEVPAGDTASDLGDQEIESGEVAQGTDEVYTVTVDGEELQVPFGELVNGYQRQADYTRKTQALSEQRQELEYASRIEQALANDPAATIELLRLQYLQEDAEAAEQDLDPDEQRWAQLDALKKEFEDQKFQTEIDNQLTHLRSSYGEFNEDDVFEFAIEHRIPDLEIALQAMNYQGVVEQHRRKQEDQKVQERKASAPPVATGHGTARGAVTPGAGPVSSLDDAFNSAWEAANA